MFLLFKYGLSLLVLVFIGLAKTTPIIHEFHFKLAYASNGSSMILVNDQFPGPTIRVNVHDLIVVHVHNNLETTEELAIHFHGILQRETPDMDGVGFVTQMPIPRGKTFTHRFHAYPAGTHMYHSHAGLQAITTFGALIVDDPFRPWRIDEVPSGPIMFSDHWQNIDRFTQEKDLLASPFQWPGEPDNILINGQTNFVLTLNPNRKYLLRLIGATSLSTIVFGINEHPMTVVEVDGKLVVPKTNLTSIEIASGQRYAVIIETQNQYTGIFIMQASIRWRLTSNNSSAIGLLRYGYQSAIPSNLSALERPNLMNETELLSFSFHQRYQTLLTFEKMPTGNQGRPDLEIVLMASQQYTKYGQGIRWLMNNATLDMFRLKNLTRPLLLDVYEGIETHLPMDLVYTLAKDQLVDIVVQNSVALNGICESHPMHMHGHKFWIHSYGTGLYNSAKNIWPDRHDPVLRDSLMVYASSYAYFNSEQRTTDHGKPCGWTKLRLIANNPGLWMFHCHIGAHAFMGMNVLLKEDIEHLSVIKEIH